MRKKRGVQVNTVTGLRMRVPTVYETALRPVSAWLMGWLLACLGMTGVAFVFATAFGLPVAGWAYFCCAVGLPLVFTLVCSLPKGKIILMLLLAAVYGFFLWDQREIFVQGFIHVVNQMFAAISQQTMLELPQYVTEPATRAAAAFSVSLFGVMVLAPWAALMSLAVVRVQSFLLCFLLSAPFLVVPVAVYAMPALWALLAMLLFWICAAVGGHAPKGSGVGVHIGVLALPGAALCLLLVCLVVPMEGYQRPPHMEVLRQDAERFAMSLPGHMGKGISGGGAAFLTTDQRHRSFTGLGQNWFSGRTALRVKTEPGNGVLYLKGFTGSVYTQDGWDSLDEAAMAELTLGRRDGSQSAHPLNFTANLHPRVRHLPVTVQNLSNPKVVYAPYGLVDTPEDLPDIEFVGDADLRAEGFFGLEEYTLSYVPPNRDARNAMDTLDNRSDMLDYFEKSYDYYTQVPEGLAPVLEKMLGGSSAQITIGEQDGTRKQVSLASIIRNADQYGAESAAFAAELCAGMVGDLVREAGTYTLTPGAVPQGRDFTEYFLTENEQGFCIHFATAAVLLLRQLGVPARYAEGYVLTPSDQADKKADGFAEITDRRAHAWAEYYVHDLGWQVLDATPGFHPESGLVQGNTPATPTPKPSATATPKPSPVVTPKPSALPSAPPTTTPQAAENPGSGQVWKGVKAVLQWVLWPLVLVLAVLLRRYLVLDWRRRKLADRDANRAVLAAYALAQRLVRYVGVQEDGMTDLAQKARFSQHVLTADEVEAMGRYLKRRQDEALQSQGVWGRFVLRFILCLV